MIWVLANLTDALGKWRNFTYWGGEIVTITSEQQKTLSVNVEYYVLKPFCHPTVGDPFRWLIHCYGFFPLSLHIPCILSLRLSSENSKFSVFVWFPLQTQLWGYLCIFKFIKVLSKKKESPTNFLL